MKWKKMVKGHTKSVCGRADIKRVTVGKVFMYMLAIDGDTIVSKRTGAIRQYVSMAEAKTAATALVAAKPAPGAAKKTKPKTTKTREEWLMQATRKLAPMFKAHKLDFGLVRVAVGIPTSRAMSAKKQTLGEAWSRNSTADGAAEIWITPMVSDAVRVLDILVHELLHACFPKGTGHKAPFARAAKTLGLEGKPTATYAGEELEAKLKKIAKQLGDYPQPAFNPKFKKQGTRLLKAVCPKCLCVIRITRKWAAWGLPYCGACNGKHRMVLAR